MSFPRIATATAAVAFACAALPSLASAADYCVYPNTSCGSNSFLKLQDAFDVAAGTADADRVLLGQFTYVGDPTKGFYYNGTSPIEIVGAGRGQTILTSPKNGQDRVLVLSASGGGSVHDLTLRIPAEAQPGFRALFLIGPQTASRIEVVEDQSQGSMRSGAELWGDAVFEDSTVTLADSDTARGVLMDSSIPGQLPSHLRGMTVRAGGGVVVGGGTIERSRVTGGDRAVLVHGGNAEISNSLLTLTKTYGAALQAQPSAVAGTRVTADGLTVLAPSSTLDTVGIGLTTAPNTTKSVHLNLTNSIVRAGVPLFAIGTGAGTATLSASYSDYNPVQNVASQNASIDGFHVSNVGDAGFNENAGHEYELLPTSQLLDRGDPDATLGLDLNGNARAADGNGDGFARRDLGAFELQPAAAGPPPGGGNSGGPAADTTAPVIRGFRAAKRRVRVAHGTRFSYTLSESSRVTLRFKRIGRHGRTSAVGTLKRAGSKGLNNIRFSGRIGRRTLSAGRYRAVIRAIDEAGNRSAPSTVLFRIVR